jgi:hypothetical protein
MNHRKFQAENRHRPKLCNECSRTLEIGLAECEARQMLAAPCGRSPRGFDCPDLEMAKVMMDEPA